MITTDTGAKKIEATDNWRGIFGAHNDTVDAYDRHIEALQDALGVVVDGDQSAVSASIGQYVILKNSSIVDSGDDLLPDGLYTAAQAIPANTSIDKTYLTAVSGGGLNALNSNLTDLIVTEVVNMPSASWSAGTPGTWIVTKSKSVSKTGYTLIGALLKSVTNTWYQAQVSMYPSRVEVDLFRATNSAESIGEGNCKVQLIWMKNLS